MRRVILNSLRCPLTRPYQIHVEQGRQQIRSFGGSGVLHKDEDKSKQALKKLGLSLSKGKVKPQEQKEHVEPEQQQKQQQKQQEEQQLAHEQNRAQHQDPHSQSHQAQSPSSSSSPTSSKSAESTQSKSPNDADSQDPNNNHTDYPNDINDSYNDTHDPTIPPVEVTVDENTRKIQSAYETIAYMTTDDLMIQQNLDQGTQFNTFGSEHYLDRKSIIRNIPDEIDIFDTPMDEINKIYESLSKLDNDKSVQLKYFKRYLKNYDDPIIQLLQQFNKINDKFKLLRRNEIDSLALAPNAFLYKENLCNHAYNVLGFDRSITGLPLRTGKHKLSDKCYPQEFIEDLNMFRTKLSLHKRDLNFIELDDDSTTIDPSKLHRKFSKVELTKFLNSIYQELEFPKFSLSIGNVSDYHNLELNSTYLVNEVEYEVLQFKKSLQKEIESFMASNGKKVLLLTPEDLKPNQFKLGETDSRETSLNNSLMVINYNFKNFNLVPGYGMILNSRRQHRYIHRHLFKIFMINLEDQIDTLYRVKYYNQPRMKRFMKSVKLKVHDIIDKRLMKIVTEKTLPLSPAVDALIHKPNDKTCFKRIYWLDNYHRNVVAPMRPTLKDKKSSFNVNFEDFNAYIKLQQRQESGFARSISKKLRGVHKPGN